MCVCITLQDECTIMCFVLPLAYTDIPDTGAVVEEGMSLANLFDVPQVPDIQTVIIVHCCELGTGEGGRGEERE